MNGLHALGLLFVFAFSQAEVFAQVRSEQIRKLVCDTIYKQHRTSYSVVRNCLKYEMFFTTSIKKSKVSGHSKPMTTLMGVSVDIEGVTYEAVVKANLGVDSHGHIQRNGWVVEKTRRVKSTRAAILKESYSNSKNVKKLTQLKSVPKDVLKDMEAYETSVISDLSGYSDIEIGEKEYYEVLFPKTGERIGYIALQWIASEKADQKHLDEITFDLDGNYINSVGESWSYHE